MAGGDVGGREVVVRLGVAHGRDTALTRLKMDEEHGIFFTTVITDMYMYLNDQHSTLYFYVNQHPYQSYLARCLES